MAAPRIVVVGGGLAGVRAVQAVRAAGHEGDLALVSEEDEEPYDRPPLSKKLLTTDDPSPVPLVDEPTLRGLVTAWHRGSRATGLDLSARVVHTDGGDVAYDRLVVATGVRPRSLALTTGRPLLQLRTWTDCRAIRERLAGTARVAVVGASYLGLEVAASLRAAGHEVVVHELLDRALATSMPALVGQQVERLHRAEGVDLRFGVAVTSDDLDADLAIVAIGAVPNTEWLRDSGLELDDGVLCDEHGRTSYDDVLVCGDVARLRGTSRRTEHWSHAGDSGRAVGHNVVVGPGGEQRPLTGPAPYFWSDQYSLKLQSLGHVDPADEVHLVAGAWEEPRWLALTHRGDRVTGAVGASMPGPLMRCRPVVLGTTTVAEAVDAHPWAP